MTIINLLTKADQNKYSRPPNFSKEQRPLYFHLKADERKVVNSLRNPINRIGFLIQFAYFKSNAKFYPVDRFKIRDIKYAAKLLGLTVSFSELCLQYALSTQFKHRTKILCLLDWQAYNDENKALLQSHANWYANKQHKPTQILDHLIDFCWEQNIEIPHYTEMSKIISLSYTDTENVFLSLITDNESSRLDELTTQLNKKRILPLTHLKQPNQSIKTRDIVNSVKDMLVIESLFDNFQSIIKAINLNDQALSYYATWVEKATADQLNSFVDPNKIRLYLLAYFQHQYFIRQDDLGDILLKSMRASLTTIQKKINAREIKTRKKRNEAIQTLTMSHKTARMLIKEIEQITHSTEISPNEKYYKIEHLVSDFSETESQCNNDMTEKFEQQLIHSIEDNCFYKNAQSQSQALQLKLSGIVKVLSFDAQTSNARLMAAIENFKQTDGQIGKKPILSFLSKEEKTKVMENDKFNISLYKFLLFRKISDGLKSGDLNLLYSYRFRAVENYLISSQDWKKQNESILATTGLNQFSDIRTVLSDLKQILNSKYETVNKNYQSGENKYLGKNAKNQFYIDTPKTNYSDSRFISSVLSQAGMVPIQKILTDIDQATGFSDHLVHHSNKNSKLNPSLMTKVAGLIGKGCNIGLDRLANISVGVNKSTLKNTVNWCFDRPNLQAVNWAICNHIKGLALPQAYLNDENNPHSSSDGRKVVVHVDSLLSGRSFKYYGKEKGVVIYSFIDETQSLFYSTVISSSEREAPYVIDGLMNNSVPEKSVHSTDEFGFTESIFGATHLLGVSFAPRFKKVGKKVIYGFSNQATYRKKGYEILPSRVINKKIIIDHWDDILRFIATIKLNHATASQLFTRLSSYAKENPLYKALKEFGRVIKSIYILTYYNDVKLRQRIQKQLNRIEASNKFSKAVLFDNNQEFQQGLKEEQEITTACKVIIQNAIVLWNYLYLSQEILAIEDKEERENYIGAIKRGSVITWGHVNLRGNYDFRRKAANDSQFDLESIKLLKIS